MPQKPGRNDPCWCGSGRKYKNCHLREDEAVHARQAVRTHLTERLSEFALTGRLKKDFESAIPFFFGKEFSIEDIADDAQKLYYLSRALEFFVHDYPLPDGQRVIERFIAEQGKRLSSDERALLNDWLHSLPAVYEVTEVRRGEGMRLRDLLSGEEFDVRAVRGTEQVSRWDLLFTRVLWTRDHYEMGGGGMRLPSRFRGWLRSHVDELWSKYRWNHPDASYEDFLHASAQLINQFILNEVEPVLRQPPTLVTMEGDLTEFCTATFDVLDYPLALAGLRAAEEFHEVEEEKETDVKAFAWHEVGESLALLRAHGSAFEYKKVQSPQAGALRVLGHLTLTADELKLEVTSRRRLAAGTELLEKRVGSAIQHREDEIKPLQMEPGRSKVSVDKTAEIAEELPEEVEAWQAEMMAQYHREWLDQNVPALDGKTPREAVKTLGGRVRVIRLLKEFEEQESVKARAGKIAYDLDELKTELGLTDQEFLDESRLDERIRHELIEIEELAHEDRVDEALAAWRALRQKYPLATERDLEFAEVWDLAGVLYETIRELTNRLAMFKRFDEGIAVMEEYITLEPEHADACRANIAAMRMERGETARGLRELEELAQRVPENHSVVTTLAFAQRNLLNCPDDAIATLQRARWHTVNPKPKPNSLNAKARHGKR